jgi:hypothetical protein
MAHPPAAVLPKSVHLKIIDDLDCALGFHQESVNVLNIPVVGVLGVDED